MTHKITFFEMVNNEQDHLLHFQKASLAPFLATLDYDKSFDHEKLDRDLAKIIDTTKRGKKI